MKFYLQITRGVGKPTSIHLPPLTSYRAPRFAAVATHHSPLTTHHSPLAKKE